MKLISRASYEMVAVLSWQPLPALHGFDENDAILVMDNVLKSMGKTY
ncbi:hypothetical protein ACNKHX_26930 [Shigella flexneri]